jgi:hypothetical protein
VVAVHRLSEDFGGLTPSDVTHNTKESIPTVVLTQHTSMHILLLESLSG